jgi:hypothetical protein
VRPGWSTVGGLAEPTVRDGRWNHLARPGTGAAPMPLSGTASRCSAPLELIRSSSVRRAHDSRARSSLGEGVLESFREDLPLDVGAWATVRSQA